MPMRSAGTAWSLRQDKRRGGGLAAGAQPCRPVRPGSRVGCVIVDNVFRRWRAAGIAAPPGPDDRPGIEVGHGPGARRRRGAWHRHLSGAPGQADVRQLEVSTVLEQARF